MEKIWKPYTWRNSKVEGHRIVVLLGIVFGVLIISSTIWFRIIRERLPRDLTQGEIYSYTFWIVLEIFLIYLIITVALVHKLQKKLRGGKKIRNPILLRIDNFIRDKLTNFIMQSFKFFPSLEIIIRVLATYIIDAPRFLIRYLHINLPEKFRKPILKVFLKICWGIFRHFRKMDADVFTPSKVQAPDGSWVELSFKERRKLYKVIPLRAELTIVFTMYILNYIPRLILASIFFYEVIVNKRIEIFYKVAWVLFIPILIYTAGKFILTEIAIGEYSKYLDLYFQPLYNQSNGRLVKIQRRDDIMELTYNEIGLDREKFHELAVTCCIYFWIYSLVRCVEAYEKEYYYGLVPRGAIDVLFIIGFGGWALTILKII